MEHQRPQIFLKNWLAMALIIVLALATLYYMIRLRELKQAIQRSNPASGDTRSSSGIPPDSLHH